MRTQAEAQPGSGPLEAGGTGAHWEAGSAPEPGPGVEE